MKNTTLETTLKQADQTRDKIHAEWLKSVQAIADKYQVEIATGHLSDTWQVNSGLGKDDFRALYDDEKNDALLELEELDAKTSEYGIGPSNMERFKPRNPYHVQAESFLTTHGLKFRATLSDSKTPSWAENEHACGHHFRVTLSKGKPCSAEYTGNIRSTPRLTFDFWDSLANYQKGIQTVSAYSVLACISGDAYTPETFAEFCAEYGYEADSIKALQTFRRCSAFAKRLRAFFTSDELNALSEIQ